MSKKPIDLTQGSITRSLFSMAVPTMLGMSFQMIYDLVDLFWIGMISSEAIAGVTVFTALFWVVEFLNAIIGQSSISLISQNHSRKNVLATNTSIEQTITFKFLVAFVAACCVALIMRPMINIFSDDLTVRQSAIDYGYIRLFFLPIMFSSYSVNTALRCIGDAKTPMKIMLLASVVNIVLDPILIFETVPFTSIPGMGLGVFGAAIATIIAQSLAFVVGFAYLFSGRAGVKPTLRGLFRLHWPTDRKLLTIGLPTGLEVLMRNLSGVVVLHFISLYGTAALAAGGIGSRILGVAFVPLWGLNMGASTIVGQSLGVDDVDRAIKTGKISGLFGTVFMATFALLCFVLGERLIGIFDSTPEIMEMGASLLRIVAIALVPLGFTFGLAACFGGSGYNSPFAVASLLSRWAIQMPLLLLFVYGFQLPVLWVWVSYMISDLAEAGVLYSYYIKGKWKTRRVYTDVLP